MFLFWLLGATKDCKGVSILAPSGLWATPPLAVEPGCEASYLSPAATRSPLVLSLCLSGGPALLDIMSLMLSFTAVLVPPAVLTVSAEDAVKPFGGE